MVGSTPDRYLPGAAGPHGSPRFVGRRIVAMLAISIGPLWWCLSLASARGESGQMRVGAGGRGESSTADLLVDYFRKAIEDRDLESFRDRVAARYSEEALCGILSDSPTVVARRAAVIALGQLGGFDRSNATLGRALRDRDPVVRELAEEALWSIWFRADTPENNQILQEVTRLTGREQLNRAEALATHLIGIAPQFAEAYNQRAIIYFHQGRLAESIQDCRRVLNLNPYHFGAIFGMARCQLEIAPPCRCPQEPPTRPEDPTV